MYIYVQAHIYIYTTPLLLKCFILTMTLQTNHVRIGFYVCNYYHLDAEISPMMSQSSSVMNFKPYLSYCYSEPRALTGLAEIISIVYRTQTSYFQ